MNTYTVTVTLNNGKARTSTGITEAQLAQWSAVSQWLDKTIAAIQCDLNQ